MSRRAPQETAPTGVVLGLQHVAALTVTTSRTAATVAQRAVPTTDARCGRRRPLSSRRTRHSAAATAPRRARASAPRPRTPHTSSDSRPWTRRFERGVPHTGQRLDGARESPAPRTSGARRALLHQEPQRRQRTPREQGDAIRGPRRSARGPGAMVRHAATDPVATRAVRPRVSMSS